MTTSLAATFAEHVQTLSDRMAHALQAAQLDGVAIYSGRAPMQFLDDQPYPFKVNPHFKAWVPLLDTPESWVVFVPGEKPKLVLYQPDDYWHKPPALPRSEWIAHFEVAVIRAPAEARQHVARPGRMGFIGPMQPEFAQWGFAAVNADGLLHRLHYQRAVKTAYEIECIRRANALGVLGHRAAEAAFRAGASEFEIHLEYLRATGLAEEELPYRNIVAINSNAAVLHYQHLERHRATEVERHAFLIDAGAQFRGYASDITRTHAYQTGEFEALIQAMEDVQQALCAQVLPGTDYVSLHLNAHHAIAQLLRDADFIECAPEDAVERGVSAIFFPHGVGHLLGLQVHDVAGFTTDVDGTQRPAPPAHPALRLTRTLAPGFVVTIEPGIYFIDSLLRQAHAGPHRDAINWRMVERYRRYGGIRIEDDVLCTTGTPENLTRAAFAQLE
jgi:Xaa-Pro dipeptidase